MIGIHSARSLGATYSGYYTWSPEIQDGVRNTALKFATLFNATTANVPGVPTLEYNQLEDAMAPLIDASLNSRDAAIDKGAAIAAAAVAAGKVTASSAVAQGASESSSVKHWILGGVIASAVIAATTVGLVYHARKR